MLMQAQTVLRPCAKATTYSYPTTGRCPTCKLSSDRLRLRWSTAMPIERACLRGMPASCSSGVRVRSGTVAELIPASSARLQTP